ncbi:hypothetical protein ONZ45_g250 [Pleurotus djamor]|nr:hypothetical protein ONZ45_g250 [Pleurotus djamor]
MDEEGKPAMVNVRGKETTHREATAVGRIYIPRVAYELITSKEHTITDPARSSAIEKARRKGDPLTVARLAAIMGSKKTSDLIPLCHPLQLSHVSVTLDPQVVEDSDAASRYSVFCTATVACEGKTGVEMEALTAVSVGLLTVWDMLKAVAGKEMEIGEIIVKSKSGGKSGDFVRQSD